MTQAQLTIAAKLTYIYNKQAPLYSLIDVKDIYRKLGVVPILRFC